MKSVYIYFPLVLVALRNPLKGATVFFLFLRQRLVFIFFSFGDVAMLFKLPSDDTMVGITHILFFPEMTGCSNV